MFAKNIFASLTHSVLPDAPKISIRHRKFRLHSPGASVLVGAGPLDQVGGRGIAEEQPPLYWSHVDGALQFKDMTFSHFHECFVHSRHTPVPDPTSRHQVNMSRRPPRRPQSGVLSAVSLSSFQVRLTMPPVSRRQGVVGGHGLLFGDADLSRVHLEMTT
ncbi:uncharacterized protein PHACADRAFT_261440 [Phanerochaete carnosa HHB-10118-sp]|uniref:Uncharacterized protein n=1 Tax=Phanerochaete carnosa (strain HHB-10118-sp) TaxID=650164 RepID=K5VN04_PHACS|nr:uncharacterized protein PHACADRAFT_261440 [Phanerochaete carnosa HHB-10118-sp]EKM52803.1 hypothetical protein PHACADRAFT_261440 [Phanerochaete carnosa HHB-10118-sp]